jgi:hypothetical protein
MTVVANDPMKAVREAFDADAYLLLNPDVAAAGLDPYDHYMGHGWREGRDPGPDFSTTAYGALNPDVAAAGINPFAHYVLYGRDEKRPVAVSRSAAPVTPDLAQVREAFDPDYYLARYPDIADQDPFEHFASVGWKEGRDPRNDFSVAGYLAAYPDVADAGLNPFFHFILHGRAEGRALPISSTRDRPAPGAGETDEDPVRAAFDETYYRATGPDLAETEDAFLHFMETGWLGQRDPNGWFSVKQYLEVNPDVEAAGVNPLSHYVLYGRAEGRPLGRGLDFRNTILLHTPPFEAHLQSLRRASPDPDPTSIDVLIKALTELEPAERLHVTVSQDDYVTSFGGIQLCLRLESTAVRGGGAAHLHLFPPALGMVVEIEREHPPIGVVLNEVFLGYFEPAAIAAAVKPLAGAEVSLAVHSLIGHTTGDLIDVLHALGVTSGFYWVHDYSSLCSGYTLMRNDVSFCGGPPPESGACGVCQYRPRRRIQMREHERLFDAFSMTVLAPSDGALALWRRSFPQRPARALAHPHATLRPRPTPRRAAGETTEPLRVGFLGMPTHHKGWPVFAFLAESFRSDPRYEFHHLARLPGGGLGVSFTSVAPTAEDPEPMSRAIEALQLDVVALWSLWPETFCFTAFEAVAAGAAVVTNPGAGNVTAFVRQEGCGLVVESEPALYDLFAGGEILKQARRVRKPRLQALTYSRMTADFLFEAAP